MFSMTSTIPPKRNRYWLLGLPFDALTLQEAVREVRTAASRQQRLFISTPNLNFLIASQNDPDFRNSVIHSDLSLADGMPIVWLAKILGLPIRERVAGASLFEALRHQPLGDGERPLSVYFFGGPDGVAEAACDAVNSNSRSMRCVGYCSPGFGDLDHMSSDGIVNAINGCHPDFVVVSLGAKKGQAWIEKNRDRLQAPILCHLGAVVNFCAGRVQRAPAWVQRLGLEWAWRIKEEPSLWRRYLGDGLSLAKILTNEILSIFLKKITRKNK